MNYKEGFVLGRFQPPHLDHLEYLLKAKEICSFLWIGITQFDIRDNLISLTAPHRSDRKSNPLTFFERLELITEMLLSEKIEKNSFCVIPFPLDKPEIASDYMRLDVLCLTTLCDEWSEKKNKLLEEIGFKVIVIIDRKGQKKISGTSIRENIAINNKQWLNQVPISIRDSLRMLNIGERLH